MAHEYTTWAYKQDLPMAMKFVLVALADRANHEGYCWPSMKDLAAMTGQSARSVINQITALVEAGFICKEERRRRDGYRASNGYILNISGEPRSDEPASSERRSCENDDIPQVNDVHPNINPPSEALSEPSKEPSVGREPGFAEFSDAYPKKTAPGEARAAFANAILLKGADPAAIVLAAKNFARKCAKDGTEERFIPSAARWLNGERYTEQDLLEDIPIPPTPDSFEGWRGRVAEYLDPFLVKTWLMDASLEEGTIFTPRRIAVDVLKQKYEPRLKRAGIQDIVYRETA